MKKINGITFHSEQKAKFSEVKIGDFFQSGGVIYKRLHLGDLEEFDISNVNAMGLISGGLTYFWPDEEIKILSYEIN